MWARLRHKFIQTLRRDFVAGLLVFVPIGVTIIGVLWILEQLDNLVLPQIFRAVGLDPADQPRFLGVIVTICVILLAGALTRSFLGRWALSVWERVVERIPVARSLYSVLKQFMEALVGLGPKGESFQRVVVIEYPRRGLYSYAFVTGRQGPRPGLPLGLLKVFISSTPNPTTGYYLLVPQDEVIDTDLSVEEAFKLIVSAGIAEVGRTEPKLQVVDPSRSE